MKKTALPLWGTVLIIAFCPLTVDSSPSWCRKFSYYANQDSASYQCDPRCLVSSSTDEGDVFGNEHYSQDSEICLAAKHAGVYIHPSGGNVFFSKDRVSDPFVTEGSVRNGVVSKSGYATSTFHFTSVTEGFDKMSCPDGRICDQNFRCVQQDKYCDRRGACYSRNLLCDGARHCSDNTDEMKCEGVVATRTPAPRTPNLSLEESLPHGLRFSWTLPAHSPPADRFIVSYQLIQNVACISTLTGEVRTASTTFYNFHARELDSYSRYKICVASVNDGGQSGNDCQIYSTGNDVPQVTLDQQKCTSYSYGSTKCQSRVGDCKKANGPGLAVKVELSTFLECEGTHKTSVLRAEDIDRRNGISATAVDLIPGQFYAATMTPVNEAGEGTPVTTSFTTKESKPPKVTDLRAEAHSSSEVRLTFRRPCPTNGRIISAVVERSIGNSQREGVSPTECPTTDTSRRCLAVSNLIPGTTYTFGVALKNSAGTGDASFAAATTKDAEPGSPTLDSLTRKDNSVIVRLFRPPLLTGGKAENCRIELGKDINVTSDVPSSGRTLDIEINNLEQGRRYEGKAVCCNKIGCGGGLDIRISTRPSKATFTSKIVIISTTNSSITVSLPKMKVEGDGERSIHILVQHTGSDNEVTNFTAEYIRLRDTTGERTKRSSMPLRRREKRQSTCKAQSETYIAGTVDENGGEFVVGTGMSPNCLLLPEEKYRIAAVGEVNLDGESSFTEDVITQSATAESGSGSEVAIALSIVFVLLIILAIVAYVVWKKYPRLKEMWAVRLIHNQVSGNDNDSAANNRFQVQIDPLDSEPPPLPTEATECAVLKAPVVPRPPPVEESIYANMADPVYANICQYLIPRSDMEAYICQIINSPDLREGYTSVPSTFNKAMTVGSQLQNKKKNRFKDNLPYDETRVKLSIVDEDPFSDYINANHISGFGGAIKYIATQGPKEGNVNTIEDFWRMICEQKVTAIIMVANFVEGGKNKVGEYFRYGDMLTVGDYTVHVLSTQECPKYNISNIAISKGSFKHKVTHYHYKSWPDHGVPNEAYTLGKMLRTVMDSHLEGCIVVHCSAGIGRTGTVLMVMLLHEMLSMLNGIEPVQVLRRLRESRARLVDNLSQYNLAFKVFEEVEYGIVNCVSSKDLPKNLDQYLKEEIRGLHAKAKAIPSNLTFSTASDSELAAMNRNTAVFPADSCRVFLQMVKAKSSSQYINATEIDGIHKSSSVIVTEHPLPTMTPKFWRLVMEKKCHSVVFIHSFNGLETEFPVLLPLDERASVIGEYSLHMQDIASYDSVVQSTVKIVSSRVKTEHFVTVYEITSWPYGTELPTSPEDLVNVCDLIFDSLETTDAAGPTLLTCGDGVIGCGLMAGLMNITDQLRRYQEVNIYRTLVRLLRVRKEFFASPAQMEFLYRAAYSYVEKHSDSWKSSLSGSKCAIATT